MFPLQGCRLYPGWAAGSQTSASRNLWDPAGRPDSSAAGNTQRKHLAGETSALNMSPSINLTLCLWCLMMLKQYAACVRPRVSLSCPSSVSTVWGSSRTTTWRINLPGCLMLDTDCSTCSSCTTHSAGTATRAHSLFGGWFRPHHMCVSASFLMNEDSSKVLLNSVQDIFTKPANATIRTGNAFALVA